MEKINKKRILVIGERFYPEEFLINDVVESLKDEGFIVTVLTQNPSYPFGKSYEGYRNKTFSKDNYFGTEVYRTRFVSGYNYSVVRKILNYLVFVILGIWSVLFRIGKHDIILIYQTGPLTQAIIGIVAKWKYKAKLVIWTWDIWPDSIFAYGFKKTKTLAKALNWFVSFIYKRCDQIWVSSTGFSEVISKVSSVKTIHFIPNWVQPNEIADISQEMPISFNQGYNLTFTGNVGKVQNLENVILGFSSAQKIEKDLQLNIIGDGSAIEELKHLVLEKNIKNVHFWGRFPQRMMAAIYNHSDALLISLQKESVWSLYIPSKFQSYLSASKPILGVINGPVRDMIIDYNLGCCADPSDIDDITSSMLSITNKKFDNIEVYSTQLLKSTFNRKTILTKIYNLLNSNHTTTHDQ